MARPAISASVSAKHLTNAEKQAKTEAESKLKGDSDKIKPPAYLNKNQKKIFVYIVKELEKSGILGNLDIYVLSECAISIDRMQHIETEINENPDLLANTTLMATKEKYNRIFFRCCNELCLSPQSRAKIGNINMQSDTPNPLLEVLADD